MFSIIDNAACYKGSAMVIEINHFDTVTYANSTFLETSGFEQQEIIGQSHKRVRHPDTPSSVYMNLWEKITKGHSWRGYLKHLYKDGMCYWVECHVVPNEMYSRYMITLRAPDTAMIKEVSKHYVRLRKEEYKLFCKAEAVNRVSF